MIGTWLNVAGIAAGGVIGLARKKPLSPVNQFFFKAILGMSTVACGLGLTWKSLNGSFTQMLKQLVIVLVSMALGKFIGRWLHLQKASNWLGQFARERMMKARPDSPSRFIDGFSVCAVLFCAAPLGWLGALQDGLSEFYYPLAIKAAMDALAAMGFIAMFGPGIVLSAVPVLVFQGTISLVTARFLLPLLQQHGLVDSVNATGGLLVFCVALIIFEVKKIEVTDYLPSLCLAPLLTYWLR